MAAPPRPQLSGPVRFGLLQVVLLGAVWAFLRARPGVMPPLLKNLQAPFPEPFPAPGMMPPGRRHFST
jgi:hypothetical protein